ncbi:MAG: N-acyl homoserine lactonase family protein [Halobacteriaceae archaeon]
MTIAVVGVDRGTIESDANYHLEAHTVASASDPDPPATMLETPVYNLVVDHPEATVLWDTGSHPEAGEGYWPEPLYDAFAHVDAAEHRLADDLAAAGYDLADIDSVVASHLHVDHAGGLHNFAGTDTPVYVHADELQFAYYSAVTDEGSAGYLQADFDRDLNWRVVHRDRHTLLDGVELVRLPGHAPGLLGLVVHREDGTLVAAGDQCEVAAHHEGHPQGAGLLWDRQAWRESLETVRELERRHDATVLYGHDPDQLERILAGWD